MNRFVRRFAAPVAVLVATAGLLIVHAESASAEVHEHGFWHSSWVRPNVC